MWQVQVGQPKDASYKSDWHKDLIGKPVLNGPGADGNEFLEYETRAEARAAAKEFSNGNHFWNYRVRQV